MILQSVILLCLAMVISGEMIIKKIDSQTMYHASESDPCKIETPEGLIDLSSLKTMQFSVVLDIHHSIFYWMISWCKKEVTEPPIGSDGQPLQACDTTDIPSYLTQHIPTTSACEYAMINWLSGMSAEKRAVDGIWVVTYKIGKPATYLPEKEGVITIECEPTLPFVLDCKKNTPSDPCVVRYTNAPAGALYSSDFVSPLACPGAGSGGGGGGGCGFGCIFLLVFFLGGFVYLVVFMAYNYKVKELRGRELLPHQEFWKSIPGLCKDGAIFLFQKIRSLCGSS